MKIETGAGVFKATAFIDGHPIFIGVEFGDMKARIEYADLPDLIYTLTRLKEKIKQEAGN